MALRLEVQGTQNDPAVRHSAELRMLAGLSFHPASYLPTKRNCRGERYMFRRQDNFPEASTYSEVLLELQTGRIFKKLMSILANGLTRIMTESTICSSTITSG